MKKTVSSTNIKILTLITVLVIGSCKKDTETTPEKVVTVAPLVVESVTPANVATGVKTDAKIEIKFNKKPSTTTQQGTGISIIDKDNKVVSVTFTYDGSLTISCTPKEALFSSEVYKVNVKGATADDGATVTEFNSTFTVEKIPFKVVSIVPADNTTGVSINSKVVITFSKKLNSKVATGSEFILAGMNASTSSTAAYDAKFTITLTPTAPMKNNTIYSTYILNLFSEDGDKITQEVYSFTTEK